MNGFDAAVGILVIVAIVMGFKAGFLRSIATILGYLSAMPIALAITPLVSALPMDQFGQPWAQNSLLFFAVFVVTGAVLGTLLRVAVGETIGPHISVADRLVGSLFGAARIGLVAVTLVVIFDRLIPIDRQPPFLNGSHLRPILSMAGQKSLKSLPADVTRLVDHLKEKLGI
jgi:membrane protein required for colicin V production